MDREIDFYIDAMVVETLLSNNAISKTAQSSMVSDLISKTKQYFENHIDPDDKAGSVLNLLAPGVISMVFKAMNLSWLGILIGPVVSAFNIDVSGILSAIYNEIKSYITQDKQLSSSQVQSIVDSAVQQHTGNITLEEAERAMSQTGNDRLREARLLKLAMIAYEADNDFFIKEAKFNWGLFSSRRAKTSSVLSRVLGFFFKTALASAGFLVAGDIINKFLGRPNAFDNTIQKGKPVETAPPIPTVLSKQTKFPVNPSYVEQQHNGSDNWIERATNTENGISNMVISFAKEVYQGLNGLESQIQSSPTFQQIINDISWYNHASAGSQMVFIPTDFTSKKQLVDHFIDEVAAKAP